MGSLTKEGHQVKLPIQVADVLKILVSIVQLVHSGNKVVFDSVDCGGSYIEQKATGKRTQMYEKGGNFVFPLKVRKAKGSTREQGFQRQVAVIQAAAEEL